MVRTYHSNIPVSLPSVKRVCLYTQTQPPLSLAVKSEQKNIMAQPTLHNRHYDLLYLTHLVNWKANLVTFADYDT